MKSAFLTLAFAAIAIMGTAHAGPAIYTKVTAPDALSRQILADPLIRIEQATSSGFKGADAVHVNFAKFIDQNFAQLDSRSTAALLDGLSDAEMAALASAYWKSIMDTGHSGRALDILAIRTDGVRLGRAARHFGFVPVYEAVVRSAPKKSGQFLRYADYLSTQTMGRPTALAGEPLLDYTLNEIYLSFRTAPYGANSVTAALYETVSYAAPRLLGAFGAGYTLGSLVAAPLVRKYAPELYDRLGAKIDSMVAPLRDQMIAEHEYQRILERLGMSGFEISESTMAEFRVTGGDYGSLAGLIGTSGGDFCTSCWLNEQ